MNRNLFRLTIVLGAATAIFRIWLSAVALPVTYETENMRVGITLATQGYFGDPFFTPTGPTAHVAPLYPFLIAGAIMIVGDNSTGFILARCFFGLVLGLFVAAMPRIATALGFTPGVGIVASLAFLFPSPPVFMWIEATGQHETVLTGVFLAALTSITLFSVRQQRLTRQYAMILGLGWGIAMHASPTLLLPMLAAFGIPGVLNAGQRPMLLRAAPLLSLGFVCAVAPWTIRNAYAVGKPVFVRDNFGIELAMSNSDNAGPDMRENMYGRGSMTQHPYFNREAALQLRAIGEVEYYRRKQSEAVQWIADNPRAFLTLTLQRIGLFFLPRLGWEHHAFFYVPVLVLWIAGTFQLGRRDPFIAISLTGVLVAYALPHFLVQSSPRYSYPVLWIMVLIAANMSAVLFRSAVTLARTSRSIR